MLEYRMNWVIPGTGPSVSTFHFEASSPTAISNAVGYIGNFFDSIKNYLPNDVNISGATEVVRYDTVTGVITGFQAVVPPPVVVGSVSGVWAAGSGVRVVWGTNGIYRDRRTRGALYIVPTANNTFSSDGTVPVAARQNIDIAAAQLLIALSGGNAPLQVWSRPRPGSPGKATPVVTGNASPLVATLRGRKY